LSQTALMSEKSYKRVTNLKTGLVTYCFYFTKSSITIEWEW
jgi:hypothetical protein